MLQSSNYSSSFDYSDYNFGDPMYLDHPEDMLNPAAINPAFIPIIVTHAATFVVGVVGNVVVIFTWTRKGQLRSQTAAFLVSLAVADLLLLVVFVPLDLLQYFVVAWDESGIVCKITSYVENLSGMATVLNLVAVSIERFLVIVYPMRARSFCTVSRSRKGLICVWLLALVLALPILFTRGVHSMTYYNNSTTVTAYYCIDGFDNLSFIVTFYQLFALFVIPGIFMTVCYFVVIKVLWSSTKTMERLTAHVGTGIRDTTSMELSRVGRRLTSPSTSYTSLATNGTKGSNSRNVAPDPDWTSGVPNGVRNKRREDGNRNEYRKVIKAPSFCPTEPSSPSVRVHASPLGAERAKTTQFVIDSGKKEQETEETSTRTDVNPCTGRQRRLRKKVPVQLRQTSARKQVIKMLLLVIVLFLVCWGPRLVFNVFVALGIQGHSSTTYTIRVTSYLLSFVHSALNPFVYGLMSTTFRNIVFKSCAGRKRGNARDSCGASGRIVVGGGSSKLASGTWAVDEIVEDDVTDTKTPVMGGKRRLLDLPRTASLRADVGEKSLSPKQQQAPDFDPRERSSSQATVLTVAPIDIA